MMLSQAVRHIRSSSPRVSRVFQSSKSPLLPRAVFFHQSSTVSMKAARVTAWGSAPSPIEVPDLPAPGSEELRLKILAVGVARAVRGRAARQHPSAFNQPLPYDPSADGVGLDESTGSMYYIQPLVANLFATHANIKRNNIHLLPSTADAVKVAALSNPTSSSYMALTCRADGDCSGRTILIIGATSASGRAGAIVSKALGAAKVVGMARDKETLNLVEGLDERIVMPSSEEEWANFKLPEHIGPVDIVLDWVGGSAITAVLRTAVIRDKSGENLQYIQCGGLAGQETISVPGRLINIKPIKIMASGVGSLRHEELQRALEGLSTILGNMQTTPFEVVTANLDNIHEIWESSEGEGKRLVIVP